MNDKDYIYCSVRFDKKGKSYYYLTEDEAIEIGDYVEVPGMSRPSVAEVVRLERFKFDEVPYRLDKMKSVTKLVKKHNAPKSKAKSLLPMGSKKNNPQEDLSIDGLFDCMEDIKYKAIKCLTEEQVAFFEEINNIKLPVQYKEMLLKKGNGIYIYYEDFFYGEKRNDVRVIKGIRWNKKYKNDILSRQFMFGSKTRVHMKDLPFPQYMDCMMENISDADNICDICDHRNECVHSFTEQGTDTAFYNGTLEILGAGCTYSYHLILNGPRRGEVWISDDNWQFVQSAKSFKEFLKKVCTAKGM